MADTVEHGELTPTEGVFDSNKCVFCSERFTDSNPSCSPDISKLGKLFDACRIRNDTIGNKLLANNSEIKQGLCKIFFHKNCKATYQSSLHIKRALKQADSEKKAIKSEEAQSSTTRSAVKFFDWKKFCFICGEVCDPVRNESKLSGSWSMVESSTDTKKSSMYSRVNKAAEKRGDTEVLTRLRGLPNADLVAVEARYHRKKNCLLKYTSERKIHQQTKASPLPFKYTNIGLKLKDEYEDLIMNERNVIELSVLRDRFRELAAEAGLHEAEYYKTSYIKNLLANLWPELSFIYRPGMTDLVCSADLSVGEALHMADKLSKSTKQSLEEQYDSDPIDIESEDSVLHNAVGILKNHIRTNTVKLTDQYYSSDEMNLSALKAFVDPLLYKIIGWLASDERYAEASDISVEPPDVKCLTIACDLTKLITSISSPKHLGLAVHLHNEYGSRRLIEELSNLGYTISYSELRCFLTSAASYITNTQPSTPSGGLVSSEILPIHQGGKLILGAADNWDHNERTVDGKRTTHAMTSILVSPKTDEKLSIPRLPRKQDRTFDVSSIPGGGLSYVVPYRKPQKRPEPVFAKPVTIHEIAVTETDNTRIAKMKELLYNIGRCDIFYEDLADKAPSIIPPWSVFHALLNQECPLPVCNVSFNPILMATPSDYSTIYTTLLRMKESMNALGQSNVPVFFDMGLLSKALEIVWARKEELSGVIPCEGGMHLLMSVFAGIGHIYGDAGLKQLLSESDVYAAGTVQMILSGKDFDRALMASRLVDEVLHDRLLKQFNEWCIENDKDIDDNLKHDLLKLRDTLRGGSKENAELVKVICGTLQENVISLLEEFKTEGSSNSPTFKFWIDYLDKVSVPLKLYLSSSRTGDWETHQYAKQSLLPFLFASNRTIYSRYMTVEQLQMKRLPDEVLRGFNDGLFVAKLTEGCFNSVWMDYVLETTENKSLKGSEGIIGMTLKGNALARWFLSRPITAKYSMEFHENICLDSENLSEQGKLKTHHTDSKAQCARYNENVNKIAKKFDSGLFIDPFDVKHYPDRLVNIATGVEASLEVEQSLIGCLVKGEEMMKKFVDERLIIGANGDTQKSFFDTLQKCNIKTMTDTSKGTQVRSKVVQIDADVMFQRLLAINSYKKVPAERVFSFENTPVPVSLFDDSGKMLTSKKSDFMSKLEGLLDEKIISLDSADCVIFDGMAIVQMLDAPKSPTTYKDMATGYFQHVIHKARNVSKSVKSIHIVFDRYLEDSLKKHTRMKRGDKGSARNVHIVGEQCVPSVWKSFLSNGSNKDRLVRYYSGFIQENASLFIKDDEVLYVTDEERVLKITTDNVVTVEELKSNQEEADTRMVLHAAYAADNGAKSVVVYSPDTDVLVLLLHHRANLCCAQLHLFTGHSGKHTDLSRFIPVHELSNTLSENELKIILAIYCLTGCDTTSALYGKGKKTAFKLLVQSSVQYADLNNLGNKLELTDAQKRACCCFIGSLYGKKDCTSINTLRAEKAKSLKPKNLPPTENSFVLHCLRCVYQLFIWRNALKPVHELKSPSEFGFEYDTEVKCWQPLMMTQPVAAPELLNDVVCDCEDVCDETCTCSCSRQPCTIACSCKAAVPTDEDDDASMCTNVHTILSAMFTQNYDSGSDSEN